jgi:Icc-related predicted phosphoesterase
LLEETLLGPPADLGTVRCDVICCHGNHEDFEELGKATGNSAMASLDVFGRINLLRSGEVTSIAGIRIGALGGAPETETSEGELLGKYVSAQGANRLLKQSFDILLTHGSPRAIGGESDRWGSRLIRNVIENCQPAYNFFGHHRSAISPAIIKHTG